MLCCEDKDSHTREHSQALQPGIICKCNSLEGTSTTHNNKQHRATFSSVILAPAKSFEEASSTALSKQLSIPKKPVNNNSKTTPSSRLAPYQEQPVVIVRPRSAGRNTLSAGGKSIFPASPSSSIAAISTRSGSTNRISTRPGSSPNNKKNLRASPRRQYTSPTMNNPGGGRSYAQGGSPFGNSEHQFQNSFKFGASRTNMFHPNEGAYTQYPRTLQSRPVMSMGGVSPQGTSMAYGGFSNSDGSARSQLQTATFGYSPAVESTFTTSLRPAEGPSSSWSYGNSLLPPAGIMGPQTPMGGRVEVGARLVEQTRLAETNRGRYYRDTQRSRNNAPQYYGDEHMVLHGCVVSLGQQQQQQQTTSPTMPYSLGRASEGSPRKMSGDTRSIQGSEDHKAVVGSEMGNGTVWVSTGDGDYVRKRQGRSMNPVIRHQQGGTTSNSSGGYNNFVTVSSGRRDGNVSQMFLGGSSSTRSQSASPSGVMRVQQQQHQMRIPGIQYGESNTRKVTGGGTAYSSRLKSSSQPGGDSRVIAEHCIERDVRVPRRVVREDLFERVIVVPEKVVTEEYVEETARVRETIIEVAKPIIEERIVEVPEYEYIEKITEVPERIVQEKIVEVPRTEIVERVVEVPRVVYNEKQVEVPIYEYREVLQEKVIEVPQVVEEIVVREVSVPVYVEKQVPEFKDVEVEQVVHRNVPVPIENVSVVELKVPQIRANYETVDFPVYVPRFVEVAVPADLCDDELLLKTQNCHQMISQLVGDTVTTAASSGATARVDTTTGTSGGMPIGASLCELEELAARIQNMDFESHLNSIPDYSIMNERFRRGELEIDPESVKSVCQVVESGRVVTEAVSLIARQSGGRVTGTTTIGDTSSSMCSSRMMGANVRGSSSHVDGIMYSSSSKHYVAAPSTATTATLETTTLLQYTGDEMMMGKEADIQNHPDFINGPNPHGSVEGQLIMDPVIVGSPGKGGSREMMSMMMAAAAHKNDSITDMTGWKSGGEGPLRGASRENTSSVQSYSSRKENNAIAYSEFHFHDPQGPGHPIVVPVTNTPFPSFSISPNIHSDRLGKKTFQDPMHPQLHSGGSAVEDHDEDLSHRDSIVDPQELKIVGGLINAADCTNVTDLIIKSSSSQSTSRKQNSNINQSSSKVPSPDGSHGSPSKNAPPMLDDDDDIDQYEYNAGNSVSQEIVKTTQQQLKISSPAGSNRSPMVSQELYVKTTSQYDDDDEDDDEDEVDEDSEGEEADDEDDDKDVESSNNNHNNIPATQDLQTESCSDEEGTTSDAHNDEDEDEEDDRPPAEVAGVTSSGSDDYDEGTLNDDDDD